MVLSDEDNNGYILGFRINPIEKLNTLHKEINILIDAYKKSPIFGVDYTLEYQVKFTRYNDYNVTYFDIFSVESLMV